MKKFELKSGQIKVSDLAQHISAFANADGGTLVIGISDNGREKITAKDLLDDYIVDLVAYAKKHEPAKNHRVI